MSLLSVPLGTILPFWAQAANHPLPFEYEYCDGRTLPAGTHKLEGGVANWLLPNLVDKFILGSDATKASGTAGTAANGPSNAPGINGVGGSHTVTLATAHLPAHNHTASSSTTANHTHGGNTDLAGVHYHGASNGSGFILSTNGTQSMAVGGAHLQNNLINGATSLNADPTVHTVGFGADPNHTHNLTVTTASSGGVNAASTPFSIRPRYVGLVFIMKVR